MSGERNRVPGRRSQEKPELWMWFLLFVAPYIGIWFFFSSKYAGWRKEVLSSKPVRVFVVGVGALFALATLSMIVIIATHVFFNFISLLIILPIIKAQSHRECV